MSWQLLRSTYRSRSIQLQYKIRMCLASSLSPPLDLNWLNYICPCCRKEVVGTDPGYPSEGMFGNNTIAQVALLKRPCASGQGPHVTDEKPHVQVLSPPRYIWYGQWRQSCFWGLTQTLKLANNPRIRDGVFERVWEICPHFRRGSPQRWMRTLSMFSGWDTQSMKSILQEGRWIRC